MEDRDTPHHDPAPAPAAVRRPLNAFWPVLILSLSILAMFGWIVWTGVQSRQKALEVREQQEKSVERAREMQRALERLARDLVELGKTDPDAQALVTQFRINVVAPSGAAQAPFSSATDTPAGAGP